MKSIKQQYIDLREGNLSQANFMRNLRMTLPQYITNVTSFNDSVRILKNKGILTEADTKVEEMYDSEGYDGGSKEMFSIKKDPAYAEQDVAGLLSRLLQQGNTLEWAIDFIQRNNPDINVDTLLDRYNKHKEAGSPTVSYNDDLPFFEGKEMSESISDDDIMKKYNEMFGKNPQTKFADVAKALNIPEDQVASALQSGAMPKFGLREAKDNSSEGKWKTTTGKDLYAHFKEIDNLNGQEVLIGIDYEREKNPEITKAAAVKIVIKNLKKNPIYYTASLMAGKEGYEPEYIGEKSADPKAHQMKPVKGNDMVDKARGMKPVKDVEKVKKDADAKKETNSGVKGVESMSLIAKAIRGLVKMDATGEKMKKISVKENKVASTIFTKNAGAQAGVNAIAKGDDYVKNYNANAQAADAEQAKKDAEKAKKDTETQLKATQGGLGSTTDLALSSFPGLRERLKELIRKELKEITGVDGGDAMTAPDEDGSSYVNEDIYGIAGDPKKEKAARLARKPKDKYEPLSVTKADKDRDLDAMLDDAENNMDSLVSQVGNDTKLGIALIARARETKPSLFPGLQQALNLYNK